jgi:type I restriction enzyme S subunit
VTWKTVPLGEIIELQNGFAFKSSEYAEEGYFLMRITNVQQGFIQNNNPRYVSIPKDSKLKQFILNDGDILMSLTGDVGRVGIVKESNLPAALNQRVARVIIKSVSAVDRNYLFNLLNSELVRTKIESFGHGAAQLNVSTKDILSLRIPLPPLTTQRNIVAKLDAIFTEIDKATAAAEANAKNAEALFSQVLNNLDSEYSGVYQNLGDCVELVSGFAFKSSEYTDSEDDIPLLRGDNLNPMSIDFSEAKRFDKKRLSEYHKFWLSLNDIVLGMDRPLISTGLRIAKVQAKDLPSLLVQRVMRLRCSKVVNPDFLFYLLNSDNFIKHLAGEQTGLGVPHISGKTISSFQVKIPSIEIQRNAVSKLLSIEERLNSYKLANRKILNNWKLYRQSILKKAFSGELVEE